jgi:purine-nucleoside phosphorylase
MSQSTELIESITTAKKFIQQYIGNNTYEIGIIMGTGLEAMSSKINVTHTIPYHEIPGFPTATVSFHKGNLLIGTLEGKQVIAMQGRLHYYEGYSSVQITFPIRVMHSLGITYLLVSNAAGGLNLNYKKGDLVVINDHINLLPDNPLRGINDAALGERFVDMCAPYSNMLIEKLLSIGKHKEVTMHQGIYVAVQGPNLETRAEYRWLRNMGADVVGMSTVPEIIVANQLGIACAAVSVVTDECDPNNLQPVNIADIITVAGKADILLTDIYAQCIAKL